MAFSDLGLSGKVLQAVESSGYTQPTPIQSEAIPHVLARRDVLGIAQTGTGKTAAFTLPMLTLLETGRARARMPRTLILEPTRELAAQVEDSFIKYGVNHRLNVALLIGGVSFADQDAKITRGVDVLIATPGRLLDHFERGKLLLSGIEVLVIDEADRMLDMGFIPDIERICKMVPFTRQTLFFSATMPPEIQKLVDNFLSNPARVEVARASSTATTISQLAVASGADASQKRKTLRRLISGAEDLKNGIIFCNRKRDIAVVQKSLEKHGFSVVALHGDMDQRSRMQALDKFRNNEVQLLVASDVAARGLDIPDVSHVFNYDTPHHAEDYVHRIGRTGRAGRKGTAYTIITSDDAKSAAAIVAMSGKEFEWFGPTIDEASFNDADDGEAREHRHDRKRGKDGRRGREGSGREASGRESASRDGSGREKNRRDPVEAAPQPQESQPRQPVAESRHAPRPEGRNAQRDDRRGRNGRHDRERDRERDEPTAPGFGDHTPAFMLVASPDARRTSGSRAQRHAGPVTPVAIMPTAQDRPVQDLAQAEQPSLQHSGAPEASSNADSQDAGGGERRERRKRDRRRRGGRRDGAPQAADAVAINDAGAPTVVDGDAGGDLDNEATQRPLTPTASVQVIAIEERAAAPSAAPVEQAPVPAETLTGIAAETPVSEVAEKPKRKRAPRKTASAEVEARAEVEVTANPDEAAPAATPVKPARTRARKAAATAAVQGETPVVASSDAAPVESTGETPAAVKPPTKARAPKTQTPGKAAAKALVADADASAAIAGTGEASETAAPVKKPSSRRKVATPAAGTAAVLETPPVVVDEAQAPKAARSSRTRTRRSARAPGQEQNASTGEPADS